MEPRAVKPAYLRVRCRDECYRRHVNSTDIESHYLGEPRERLPWVALGLSLLSPGTGWAYVGRLGVGLLWNSALVALWAGFVFVWATRKFYPGAPLVAFAAGWFLLIAMSAIDVVRAARRSGGSYIVRESNHPLVYVAVAVFSFAMPLAGLHYVAFNSFWKLTPVEDNSMYPTLVAGDHLLVDTVTFQHRAPVPGELVTFALEDGAEHVARVVGGPGDVVVLSDEFIFVNDSPVIHRRLDPTASQQVEAIAGARREELGHFIEEQGRLAYHIALPRVAYDAQPEEWLLGTDQFLLLHDNRASIGDSRRVGPVTRANITGRPVYIGYSDENPTASGFILRATGLYDSGEDFRVSRQGRRVQPAPPRS